MRILKWSFASAFLFSTLNAQSVLALSCDVTTQNWGSGTSNCSSGTPPSCCVPPIYGPAVTGPAGTAGCGAVVGHYVLSTDGECEAEGYDILAVSPGYAVCPDAECDFDYGEDCSTCPQDCGACPIPPPPQPICVPDGSCSAANPSCGETTTGVDNCNNPCDKVGPVCPPPPPTPPPTSPPPPVTPPPPLPLPPPPPGSWCGDGTCDPSEDCSACEADCGVCIPPPTPPPPVPPPPASPPPIPPPGPCGTGIICGNVTALEATGFPLKGVVIELRDGNGMLVNKATTNGSGNYSFSSLAGKHFVYPVMDRKWSSTPGYAYADPSDQKDFVVRGVPAGLTVTGNPGDFVLISADLYTGLTPPNIGPSSTMFSISKTIDSGGQSKLHIPAGRALFITCWEYNSGAYVKGPSLLITATPANPQTQASASCP